MRAIWLLASAEQKQPDAATIFFLLEDCWPQPANQKQLDKVVNRGACMYSEWISETENWGGD